MADETNEKKQAEGTTETTDNNEAGTATGLNIVQEAQRVRDEIKAENDRREAILKEEQKLRAEQMLAGTAGGRVEPKEPKQETAKDYAKRVMSGGLNEKATETD